MNKRDKSIVEALKTFRVLSRDQLIELYFNNLKNPINSANNVLKRLSRDGIIKCSTRFSPYVYFLADTKIKHDSQKIPHYLELGNTVIEMEKTGHSPKFLAVEPRYGKKGTIEPDIFCKWLNMPVFIEVQRSTYTASYMQKKLDLYENYFYSDDWKQEPYQEFGKEKFPTVILITDTRYPIKSENFTILQIPSITDLYNMVRQRQNKKPVERQQISVSSNLKFKSN
jgi:hypothetical protein